MAEEVERTYFFWTAADIDKFPELPKPEEVWELGPGETRKIGVIRYGLYKDLIHPDFYPPGVFKKVLTLRIWVDRKYKPTGAPYWDIHQSHLVSSLVPLLDKFKFPDYELEITWVGTGPSARPEIKVIPLKKA
jgi:hypothetical protein